MNLQEWKDKKLESVEDILKISDETKDYLVKVEGIPTEINKHNSSISTRYPNYYASGLLDDKLFFYRGFCINGRDHWETHSQVLSLLKAAKKSKDEKERIVTIGGAYDPILKRIRLGYIKAKGIELCF